jgi:hypothetical protein
LSGPTIFSQIIKAAAALAEASAPDPKVSGSEPGNYTILLIITDGIITDLEQTKEAIVAASKLPLSIIIVGVGDADFSAMSALDSDDSLLQDQRGRVAKRDIVQFVRFNDFKEENGVVALGSLARETLEELPAQILGYFTDNNIRPIVKAGFSMKQRTDGQVAAAAVTAAPAPPQQQLMVNVTVPENVKGGDQINIVIPGSAQQMTVQVPLGMQPGQVFQVSQQPPPPPDLAALGKSLLSQKLN